MLPLPLGTGTVLDYAAALAADIDAVDVFTLGPANDWRHDGDAARHAGNSVTERIETLAGIAERYEPADLLVLIDPRYWPAQSVDLSAFLRAGRDFPGATFAVPVGSDSGRAVERIAFDAKGNVNGIRRYYSRAPWNRMATAAIPYATLPVHCVGSQAFSSLRQSRSLLASTALMIQDTPLHSDVLDLSEDCGLLALNDRIIADVTGRASLPSGYSRLAPGVLVGRGTLIHESVCIESPVVIQPGVIIEEHAMIIGPTVISGGATVRRSAIVAQSVLAVGSTIASDVIVRHQIVTEAFNPVPMGVKDSGGPRPHEALQPA
ncbi:MAG: hypothetical protein ACE5FA_07190, partial [Dehalococcoidia bacterium]